MPRTESIAERVFAVRELFDMIVRELYNDNQKLAPLASVCNMFLVSIVPWIWSLRVGSVSLVDLVKQVLCQTRLELYTRFVHTVTTQESLYPLLDYFHRLKSLIVSPLELGRLPSLTILNRVKILQINLEAVPKITAPLTNLQELTVCVTGLPTTCGTKLSLPNLLKLCIVAELTGSAGLVALHSAVGRCAELLPAITNLKLDAGSSASQFIGFSTLVHVSSFRNLEQLDLGQHAIHIKPRHGRLVLNSRFNPLFPSLYALANNAILTVSHGPCGWAPAQLPRLTLNCTKCSF